MKSFLLVWETTAGNEVWREVSEEKLEGEISRPKGKGFGKIQYRQYENQKDLWIHKNHFIQNSVDNLLSLG